MALAGCRVDARVDISVRADGSGTVRATVVLDQGAARRVGGTSALRLDDLRAAGWKVTTRPQSVAVAHEFVGAAELSDRLEDLSGNSGVLRDAKLVRERAMFSSRNAVSVRVDLRHLGSGVRDDAQLRSALISAGVDVDAVSAQLDDELRDAFHLTVALHLPDGTTRSVAAVSGSHAVVAADSSQRDVARIVAVLVGTLLGLLAVVLLVGSSVRRQRQGR